MANQMFKNREEAAENLAEKLSEYKGKNAVIYALPRGGVVTGYVIAKKLNLPLDLVISRKIAHPFSPEYAIGAVAEDGHFISNPVEVSEVDQDWLKKEIEAQRAEAKRRREKYTQERIDAKNKIAIIVDDGIATGLTIKCAIEEIKHQNPYKIVVAVPVAPAENIPVIKKLVDDVICLLPALYLASIGEFYKSFPQIEDEEVIKLMKSLQN